MPLLPLAMLLALAPSPAHAGELRAALTPVETAISGTLSPVSIAIDGKIIFQNRSPGKSVVVNGEELPIQDGAGRPVFAQVQHDTIDIEIRYAKKKPQALPKIFLPSIRAAALEGSDFVLSFTGEVTAVGINSLSVPIRDGKAYWRLSDQAECLGSRHLVEVKGNASSPPRFYNLTMSMRESVPLPDESGARGKR